MVMVYHHAFYDIINDQSRISPTKRQVEHIKALSAEPLWETGEEVPLTALDEHGRFYPNKNGDGSDA